MVEAQEEGTSSSHSTPSIFPFLKAHWYRIALSLVLLLSLGLNCFQSGAHGYSNPYYAAGVMSMLASWHNFFFVSFDPAGFVSLDKPPLGFGLQAGAARLLGFSAFSITLPQALAAVLSVAVLAHLVRRIFGPLAGLVAALTLALTPISVATARTNNVDSLLVLVVLLAAWAVMLASERSSLRWLLLATGLVGVGFNVKMLEAYLVLPAFVLLYLLCAPRRWYTRVLHLLCALLVLLAISFAWIGAVDAILPAQRPYVDSSYNNSEISLALGYNGLARLFGFTSIQTPFEQQQAYQSSWQELTSQLGPSETGDPGPFRIVNIQLGGQVSWLLPLALLGMLALLLRWRKHWRTDRQAHSLLLWGTWLLVQVIFFSVSGLFHLYYLVMLAPAICALTAIGVVSTWEACRQHKWSGWLLLVALVATMLLQIRLLSPFPDWAKILTPLTFVLGLLAIVVVAISFVLGRLHSVNSVALALGLLALLITPGTWATIPVAQGRTTAFPSAGPYLHYTRLGYLYGGYSNAIMNPDPALINYLVAHQGKATYILGTASAPTAAPVILQSGKPVLALGGYTGEDQILEPEQLMNLIRRGVIRYFLIADARAYSNQPRELQGYFQQASLIASAAGTVGQRATLWVITEHCQQVPPATWRPGTPDLAQIIDANHMLTLYDCAGMV